MVGSSGLRSFVEEYESEFDWVAGGEEAALRTSESSLAGGVGVASSLSDSVRLAAESSRGWGIGAAWGGPFIGSEGKAAGGSVLESVLAP